MSTNNTSSNLVLMQKVVQQLRMEAGARRIKVSQAATELQNFCLQNAHKDPPADGGPLQRQPVPPPSPAPCCEINLTVKQRGCVILM